MPDKGDILDEAQAHYAQLAPTLPPALSGSVKRHAEQLCALVISLRAAGFDETAVRESVATLMRSYEAELTAALSAMAARQGDG